MVVSLHLNRSPQPETPNAGPEIYIQNSEGSRKLAEKISEKFHACSIQEKDLHILRESKVPAVLVELGFINNTGDREYIVSEKGQKRNLAEICRGFQYLQIINLYDTISDVFRIKSGKGLRRVVYRFVNL